MALQLGEVVEEGRREPARLRLGGLHLGPPAPHPLDDGLRLDTVLRQPAGLGGRPFAAEPGPAVGMVRRPRLRREHCHDLEVVLGHEGADRLLALDEEGEGRGLDAADREELAVGERRRSREVHPHEPVGPGASVGGVGEGVELGERAKGGEAPPDRLRGEGRDPEPADRLAAPGRLEDVAEDELALPARVRRAHDLVDLGIAEDLLHHGELGPRRLRHHERPLGRQEGEVLGRPALPLRPDLRRLGQAHEVADGPGHDVAAPGQAALGPLRRPQDAGDVAGDRGLLGHDGDGHWTGPTRRG